MSWSDAIDEIKSAIETQCSLQYIPDIRDDSLVDAQIGRGKFDCVFNIIQDGDVAPWREVCPPSGPVLWMTKIRVQVGARVKEDAFDAGKELEDRARCVTRTLLYPNPRFTEVCKARITREATRQRTDRRIVWDQRFEIIYKE